MSQITHALAERAAGSVVAAALVISTAAAQKPAATPARAVKPAVATRASAAGRAPAPTDSAAAARKAALAEVLAAAHLPGRTKHDSASLFDEVKAGMRDARWPMKGPAALAGAILPNKRIVAFYGNPLSTRMGVLGELPKDEMLAKLDREVAEWSKADPGLPVQPALHLIAVVAQGAPGKDGMYRLRMSDDLIEKVYGWAQQKHAIMFLDVQVGRSTLRDELPRLTKYLQRPDVHLAIDAEFSMHYGASGLVPGKKIGTFDASDVNYASSVLQDIVAKNKLPPKILVVHRFTQRMITNASQIKLDPRVQVVMDMDGWGPPWLKFDSYNAYERAEPVQYTGFKLFYHNDLKKGDPLLKPIEVLKLRPRPLYIQYQ